MVRNADLLDRTIGTTGIDDTNGFLVYEGEANMIMAPISDEPFTLGRQPTNTIQIKWDALVSRHHSQITVDNGGRIIVSDLDSMNGTVVNGEHVSTRQLFGCERILIGNTMFEYAPTSLPWPDYDSLELDAILERLPRLSRPLPR